MGLKLSKHIFQKRTICELIHDEIPIEGLFGIINKNEKIQNQVHLSKKYLLKQAMSFNFSKKKYKISPFRVTKAFNFHKENIHLRNSFRDLSSAKLNQDFVNLLNSEKFKDCEITSLNLKSNATNCAMLAALMANKSNSVISRKTWEEMHAGPKQSVMFKIQGNHRVVVIYSLAQQNFETLFS